MQEYGTYVSELGRLLREVRSPSENTAGRVTAALNGEPFARLRDAVEIDDLRAAGAFFTSSHLAARLIAALDDDLTDAARILDPACGAGDLLLACAARLPIEPDAMGTAHAWAQQLIGIDTHREFTRATRIRLATLAAMRTRDTEYDADALPRRFRRVRVGDGLRARKAWEAATHIVLNPPFTRARAPSDCSWASGTINSAALFVERAARLGSDGTILLAVLPDVLRSGSNYQRWRQMIETHARIVDTTVVGRFDPETDVDVFLLHAVIGSATAKTKSSWVSGLTEHLTISDVADVSVGSVVEFRHERRGRSYPYASPKSVPAWKEARRLDTTRRFEGRVFLPPFVVVRRTSRPGNGPRAVSSIVNTNVPTAVENHLLVVRPHDGTLATCWRLVGALKATSTTEWLNNRIRCRHLTVGAVANVPLPGWSP